MNHYPIFLKLENRPCVVIGGGTIAERKVYTLLSAGAQICVISPTLTEKLQQRVVAEEITYLAREYAGEADIAKALLVIAATNNRALNAEIAATAHQMNTLVNVVDNPELCSYIVPSVVDRSPVTIAVSTGGASPVLARQLRMKLETMVPASCGELATITEEYRDKVKQHFATGKQRKHFWENALKGQFAELVYAGHKHQARQLLDTLLAKGDAADLVGEVYLVGAGPGDPDLLTFKALRLMQQADVMVYDRLVSKLF